MKIMFVDDQINVLDGIAAGVHFDELGVESVRYATGADSALEMLRKEPADIILCDVEMPGKSGLELVHAVRELYPETLTILLTSHKEFEYAQESVRMGCYDYILQPAPYDEIEKVLRRALQDIYERQKNRRLFEIGKRMQTSEMELLDGVVLNLLSTEEADVRSSIELMNLLGYPISNEKKVLPLTFCFAEYRKSDTPMAAEKEIHRALFTALKQAGISYPILPVSAVDRRRQFLLLLFSSQQEDPEIPMEQIRRFFDCVSGILPKDVIQCYVGHAVPLPRLRGEIVNIRAVISGEAPAGAVECLEYDGNHPKAPESQMIPGSGAQWRALLAAGQHRVLMSEFERCLEQIETYAPNKQKAMCDLHQRITHMFFNYFYDSGAAVHTLFRNEYSYTDYMNSYTDPDSLRKAVSYMLRQVEEIERKSLPKSDIEKAKAFISDNISDPITVKDVADHVCLSAEYFTKLFKRETGQNIKEYITLTKVEAAKDMLEHSNVPVGMVALELGYTNFSHFSQVFRKYEHMSPSEYRSKVTGKPEGTP